MIMKIGVDGPSGAGKGEVVNIFVGFGFDAVRGLPSFSDTKGLAPEARNVLQGAGLIGIDPVSVFSAPAEQLKSTLETLHQATMIQLRTVMGMPGDVVIDRTPVSELVTADLLQMMRPNTEVKHLTQEVAARNGDYPFAVDGMVFVGAEPATLATRRGMDPMLCCAELGSFMAHLGVTSLPDTSDIRTMPNGVPLLVINTGTVPLVAESGILQSFIQGLVPKP